VSELRRTEALGDEIDVEPIGHVKNPSLEAGTRIGVIASNLASGL
jgi:hypothetical protein